MGPKGRKSSVSEEEEVSTDGEDSLDERKATGRATEVSGRSNKADFVNENTNYARLASGEDWNQPRLLSSGKRNCMVELEPGSGIYYQGVALKWSRTEVHFRIARQPPEEPQYLWLRLTSSRIWRGSNAAKCWTHLQKGAWKPKSQKPGKGKGKAAKRKRVGLDCQEGTEITETTRATGMESEVEDDAAGDSASPVAVKGSNAVTPECDGARAAEKAMEHVKIPAGLPKLEVGFGVAVKAEPVAPGNPQLGPKADGYVHWLSRHLQLLNQKGKLHRSPDGCNPESGRIPGFTCADSNRTGQASMKGREASSSSGSAGLGENNSRAAAGGKPADGLDRRKAHRVPGDQGVSTRTMYESEDPRSPRSPSPATPNKPGDYRAAAQRQRSSSVDGDPRSHNAGALGANACKGTVGGHRSGCGAKGKPATAKHPSLGSCEQHRRTASPNRTCMGEGMGKKESKIMVHSKRSADTLGASKVQSSKPQNSMKPKGVAMKLPGSSKLVKGSGNCKIYRMDSVEGNHLKKAMHLHKQSVEAPAEKAKPLPALVELDPFAVPDCRKGR